jgi:hypothetical protein
MDGDTVGITVIPIIGRTAVAVTDSLRTDHTGFATPESMSSPTNKRVLQLFMLRRSAVCNNFALVREGI